MTVNAPTTSTAEGEYWKDSKGSLVPVGMIRPIDKARHELVSELAQKAREVSKALADFKRRAFDDIAAFVELSTEQYGAKPRGAKGKGNLTLYSFDGAVRVQLAISEHLVFDERLQAAKDLVDECITDWSQGSRDEIRVLVQAAFQVDKQGQISTGRVLGLRRLDIKDDRWQEAMKAISDSLQVVGSKSYVRFYERVGTSDTYRPIPLDVAGV